MPGITMTVRVNINVFGPINVTAGSMLHPVQVSSFVMVETATGLWPMVGSADPFRSGFAPERFCTMNLPGANVMANADGLHGLLLSESTALEFARF